LLTGNYSQAEAFNKRALVIREENNYIGAAASNCINLGEIYMKQSKWEEAIEVLNKGLVLAEQVKIKPKIYQVHLLLSQIYKCKNDPARSLNHYEIFHELREKVQQEDNARKLIDAKLIFEAEQTKKENAIIKEQKALIEKKNLELQDTIYELTITKVSRKAKAFTLLIAIIFFVFEDSILHSALSFLSSDNYYISLMVKIGIIFSLKPINGAIEKYLLMKVLKKKKQEKKEEEALSLA
jgi:tetratricopeptide (TPR) repeat protein